MQEVLCSIVKLIQVEAERNMQFVACFDINTCNHTVYNHFLCLETCWIVKICPREKLIKLEGQFFKGLCPILNGGFQLCYSYSQTVGFFSLYLELDQPEYPVTLAPYTICYHVEVLFHIRERLSIRAQLWRLRRVVVGRLPPKDNFIPIWDEVKTLRLITFRQEVQIKHRSLNYPRCPQTYLLFYILELKYWGTTYWINPCFICPGYLSFFIYTNNLDIIGF